MAVLERTGARLFVERLRLEWRPQSPVPEPSGRLAFRRIYDAKDILADGTRVLAKQGVPRIRASTDLGNVPMANAFRRAGYNNFEREITMTWS